MDYVEILNKYQALVGELIRAGTPHQSGDLGLDPECGEVVVGEDWIASVNPRFELKSGFCHVPEHHKTRIGEWTFYSIESARVSTALMTLEYNYD